MLYKNKIIFIAPLDWGLGHATRCVPLIKKLSLNNKVILGVTPLTKLIFDEEFPNLKKIDIVPYGIVYSEKQSLTIKLLFDLPRIYNVIKKENKQLEAIINEQHIDIVISDNRLGLFNKTVETVYITHQVNLQTGLFSALANTIHHYFIKKYNTVWIPDYEDEEKSLAGKLSHHNSFKNLVYINPQSRLEIKPVSNTQFDYLFLISGPEPQRTFLENNLIELAVNTNKTICLVRGTKSKLNRNVSKNITVFDLPNSETLSQLIIDSETIISRSGYSTLMDLHKLNKTKFILIPTPSQPEQIYLAEYWQMKFKAKCVYQHQLKSMKL